MHNIISSNFSGPVTGPTVAALPDLPTFEGPLATCPSAGESIEVLRAVLDQAGFSEQGVRAALGDQSARLELKRIDFPLYERRLAAKSPLHTFIKLFMMQQWLGSAEVAEAILPLTVERLAELGLLEQTPRGVHSTCALALCDGFIIAHDRVAHEEEPPHPEHVLGVNASASTLANLTVRRRVRRVLDIGTGSGIQALLASRHADQVIATDTNPRALNYLEFNARLNRVQNIECRLGSLFAPVAGCRFDLITCNPPYVISPESNLIFRDSGMPGDLICEQVVRQAAAYLEPGGFACILCNWIHQPKQEWSEPIRKWVENNGCDTWVLRGATENPLSYAAAWTRTRSADAYAKALDRWNDYYTRSGIEALGMGAVILRRSPTGSRGWFRADDWPAKPSQSCSEQIQRIFRGEDYLREDEELDWEQQIFTLVEEHCLHEHSKFRNGELVCERRLLELERGLPFQCNLDMHSLVLLAHCDGNHTLAEAIAALSRSTGASVEQIKMRAVEVIRQLIAFGFVVPQLTGKAPISARRVAGTAMEVETGTGAASI